jgi:hypothetical protein
MSHLGGTAITYDLSSETGSPISEADQQRLQDWDSTSDAAVCRDALAAVVDQGWQQSPFEVQQNYYAVALLLDETVYQASAPTLKNSSKVALHHALDKSKAPRGLPAIPCSDSTISSVTAVTTKSTRTPVMAELVQQGCYGCCGPGCHCVTDRSGAPIYGTPCANHDSCVGRVGGYLASLAGCQVQWGRAVAYTWYRNTFWGNYFYYSSR